MLGKCGVYLYEFRQEFSVVCARNKIVIHNYRTLK